MEKIICPHCKKEFEGYTLRQVNYIMMQHVLSKHPDKFIWRDFFTGKVVGTEQDLKNKEEEKKK